MRGVVGQGVGGAVRRRLRRSGSSQQGGLVQSCLGQNGRRGGESSVGGGGGQTCKQTQKVTEVWSFTTSVSLRMQKFLEMLLGLLVDSSDRTHHPLARKLEIFSLDFFYRTAEL